MPPSASEGPARHPRRAWGCQVGWRHGARLCRTCLHTGVTPTHADCHPSQRCGSPQRPLGRAWLGVCRRDQAAGQAQSSQRAVRAHGYWVRARWWPASPLGAVKMGLREREEARLSETESRQNVQAPCTVGPLPRRLEAWWGRGEPGCLPGTLLQAQTWSCRQPSTCSRKVSCELP